MAITFNKTNQLFCHKILQTHKQTVLELFTPQPSPQQCSGCFACICSLPLRVQWHPPCRNSSQPLPFGLEQHREGRASHTAQPPHRDVSAHQSRRTAGKTAQAQPAQETGAQTTVLFNPQPLPCHRSWGTHRDTPAWGSCVCGQHPSSIFYSRGAPE